MSYILHDQSRITTMELSNTSGELTRSASSRCALRLYIDIDIGGDLTLGKSASIGGSPLLGLLRPSSP